ncbi:hypothetical protein [Streptomyces sp. NPDC088554]|uniref:hypothetical protein n=1 Tax=Streptomyces sp. NPDC088554 TaxID=3365865 RepID=UPI00381A808B
MKTIRPSITAFCISERTPVPPPSKCPARTGEPAEKAELILGESSGHFAAGKHGLIIARHHLGYQLPSTDSESTLQSAENSGNHALLIIS